MKEQRYVLCDSCNGKIYLGEEVYCFEGYCGVYCSGECFASAYATQKILNKREAEDCGCEILDDNTIEKEKEEIKKEWREVAAKFSDPRRTKILNIVKEDEEPTEIRQLQVSLTNHGNVFATEVSSLYTQRRGGVGNKFKMASGEYVIATQSVNSNEELLFFKVCCRYTADWTSVIFW